MATSKSYYTPISKDDLFKHDKEEKGTESFVNTTSNEITVSLPAGTVGAQVILQDYAGTFGTNKVIISANGSDKIQGTTSKTL